MKKIFFIFMLLLASNFVSYSQQAQDTLKSNAHQVYCEVIASQLIAGGRVRIAVDFGDKRSFWTGTATAITDEYGNVAKFNSVIDALNYMSSLGWTYQDAYLVGHTNSYVYHYIMKKEIRNELYEIQQSKD